MFIRPFIITAALLLGLSAHADDASIPDYYKVTLLTENFPPYNMSITGKQFALEEGITGIAADVVREVFNRAQIKYTMTLLYPWDRLYKTALEKPDYGIFVTARTPEREELFKWVGPIGPDDWVLFAKGDSKITLKTLDEAKKYKVGAYRGDAMAEDLVRRGFDPHLELRDQENAKNLVNGKIDLWAAGDPAGRYLASQVGIKNLKIVLRYSHDDLYLALNKQTPDEVVQKLQGALEQMRKEGKIQEILDLYL